MSTLNHALPRRTFLRGLGATMALPLLDSMVIADRPRAGPASKSPIRLGYVYTPNGIIGACDKSPRPFMWTPKTVGRELRVQPDDEGARAVPRAASTCSSGLAQVNGRALGDGPGDHARATATFLTGVHPLQDRRRRLPPRHLGRSDRGEGVRQTHAAVVARARTRAAAARRQLRLRLHLRLHVDVVARTDQPAAGRNQSADGVRAAVRRRRQHGSARAPGPPGTSEERARLRHRQPVAAAHASGRRRQAQARGVSRGGPRHRAPDSAGRRAERHDRSCRTSSGRARFPTTTCSTRS